CGTMKFFASRQAFPAGPLSPVSESLFVRKDTTPREINALSLHDALPISVCEVKTILHWPLESVLAPALSQVLLAASSTAFAPFELVRSEERRVGEAARKPFPSPAFFRSVTVKVCG